MADVCGARRLDGSTCQRPPQAGGTRCYAHGRTQAQRLRRNALAADADAEFAAALKDPDLMDVRGMVARSEAVVRRTPLIATEEMAERLARRRIAKDIGPDLIRLWIGKLEDEARDEDRGTGPDMAAAMLDALDVMLAPTEGDLDLATVEIHERSQKLIASAARTQVDAAKALDWAATTRELVLPVLSELSMRLGTWARKWVGKHAPGDVGPAVDELTTLIRRTIGEMAEAKERA